MRFNEKISIIMPVYNGEKYLPRALDSIVAQTYDNFELVIIDDGSVDKSGKICKSYAQKDSRIHYFWQENTGVACARNKALENATGDIIAFVDSDDYIEKSFLERMVEIKKTNHSQMAICDFKRFASDLPNIDKNVVPDIKVWNHDEAMKNCYGHYGARVSGILWNKIYDANLFDDIKFPVNLRNEDEFVLPKLVDKCDAVAITNEVFYYYYENENSITTNKNYNASHDIYRVYDERLEYFGGKGPDYSFFIKLTKKEYLDRIIARYKKSGLKELRQLYKSKYKEFCSDVTGIGYGIFKLSPSFYYFLVKIKER